MTFEQTVMWRVRPLQEIWVDGYKERDSEAAAWWDRARRAEEAHANLKAGILTLVNEGQDR